MWCHVYGAANGLGNVSELDDEEYIPDKKDNANECGM